MMGFLWCPVAFFASQPKHIIPGSAEVTAESTCDVLGPVIFLLLCAMSGKGLVKITEAEGGMEWRCSHMLSSLEKNRAAAHHQKAWFCQP